MNIAEILKNCPEGTKLYSPVWGDVELIKVHVLNNIEIKDSNEIKYIIYPDGKYSENGEVILFPSKEQCDWSKFLIPFKYGDVIAFRNDTYGGYNIGIFDKYLNDTFCKVLCTTSISDGSVKIVDENYDIGGGWDTKKARHATHSEKLDLLEKLANIGYEWNNNKLTPIAKFKVGDTITNGIYTFKVSSIDDKYYYEEIGITVSRLRIQEQDQWKIKKFDIHSLKPYDKVLVKNGDGCWYPTLVSYVESSGEVYLIDTTNMADYVIPFEGNEHLVGGYNDPDPYYITWE